MPESQWSGAYFIDHHRRRRSVHTSSTAAAVTSVQLIFYAAFTLSVTGFHPITHHIPLEDVADAHHISNNKLNQCIKPVLIPSRAMP